MALQNLLGNPDLLALASMSEDNLRLALKQSLLRIGFGREINSETVERSPVMPRVNWLIEEWTRDFLVRLSVPSGYDAKIQSVLWNVAQRILHEEWKVLHGATPTAMVEPSGEEAPSESADPEKELTYKDGLSRMIDVYLQGVDAHQHGFTLEACPYHGRMGGEDREFWSFYQLGWESGWKYAFNKDLAVKRESSASASVDASLDLDVHAKTVNIMVKKVDEQIISALDAYSLAFEQGMSAARNNQPASVCRYRKENHLPSTYGVGRMYYETAWHFGYSAYMEYSKANAILEHSRKIVRAVGQFSHAFDLFISLGDEISRLPFGAAATSPGEKFYVPRTLLASIFEASDRAFKAKCPTADDVMKLLEGMPAPLQVGKQTSTESVFKYVVEKGRISNDVIEGANFLHKSAQTASGENHAEQC